MSESPEAMTALADRALYAAKERGRGRVIQAHELTGAHWEHSPEATHKVNAMVRKLAGLDSQFKDLFANGSIVDMVLKLLGGRYGEVGKQVETALVGAFMEPGQVATVSLNKWADLTLAVEDQCLHVQVDLVSPIQMTLFESEVPLGDLSGGGGGP